MSFGIATSILTKIIGKTSRQKQYVKKDKQKRNAFNRV